MKDFARVRQQVYNPMLKMIDSMSGYEATINEQKQQLSTLETQASESESAELTAQIKSLKDKITVSERSLIGFKNIHARDYQMGYEHLIAQGVSEEGLSHAIEGLTTLNEKISGSQSKIEVYISNGGLQLETYTINPKMILLKPIWRQTWLVRLRDSHLR